MTDFLTIITNISLPHYMILALILFLTGLLGTIICKNIVKVLVSIEIMLNAVGISLIAANSYRIAPGGADGQILTLFLLAIGAVEAAVGIVLLYAVFTYKKSAEVESYKEIGEKRDNEFFI